MISVFYKSKYSIKLDKAVTLVGAYVYDFKHIYSILSSSLVLTNGHIIKCIFNSGILILQR